jgi:hypothetical protein
MPEGSCVQLAGVKVASNPRNPQKVCRDCQAELDPLQSSLCMSLVNAVKENKAEKKGSAAQAAAFMEGFTLGAEIRKASYTVQNFMLTDKDKRIPQALLAKAKVSTPPH